MAKLLLLVVVFVVVFVDSVDGPDDRHVADRLEFRDLCRLGTGVARTRRVLEPPRPSGDDPVYLRRELQSRQVDVCEPACIDANPLREVCPGGDEGRTGRQSGPFSVLISCVGPADL